jgi:hypothetical protein
VALIRALTIILKTFKADELALQPDDMQVLVVLTEIEDGLTHPLPFT